MKINKFPLLLLLLLTSTLGFLQAQSKQEKKADLLVEKQYYEDGLAEYQQILDKADSTTQWRVTQKMARAYYQTRQYEASRLSYKRLLDANQLTELNSSDCCYILTLFQRLENQNELIKYARLLENMDSVKSDPQFLNLQRSIFNQARETSSDTLEYTLLELPINTEFSNYWIGKFAGDSLLLLARSDKGGSDPSRTLFRGSQFYHYNPQKELISPFDELPVLYQAGPAAVYQGGQKLIYTDNNMKSGGMARGYSAVKARNLQLVFAEYNDLKGKWEIKKSIFKSDESAVSYSHPCLINDDQTLLLVTNQAGGYGGADIYKTDWDTVSQAWGPLVNLGPTVNTAGDELYPSMINSQLYFASNGHLGLGGFDIYNVRMNTSNDPMESSLSHLPEPINSRFNDYSFQMNADLHSGYLVSDRMGGKGVDNYYRFTAKPKEKETKDSVEHEALDSLSLIQEEIGSIYFDFDQVKIKDHYLEVLNTNLQKMKRSKGHYLLVGSADPRGTSAYNLKLSARRAAEVKKWFVQRGIPASQISIKARGRITLDDPEIKNLLGIAPQEKIKDKTIIRKAYNEARRVTIESSSSNANLEE